MTALDISRSCGGAPGMQWSEPTKVIHGQLVNQQQGYECPRITDVHRELILICLARSHKTATIG